MNGEFEEEEDEETEYLPTVESINSSCSSILEAIRELKSIRKTNQTLCIIYYQKIEEELKKLQNYEGISHFQEIFLASPLIPEISYLIQCRNTQISSVIMDILSDLCEFDKESRSPEFLKKSDFAIIAITSCLDLDEVNIQSDAQMVYNTFSFISKLLENIDEPNEYASILLGKSSIVSLVQKQFERVDFDDNIFVASDTFATLLQFHPKYADKLPKELLSSLLKCCWKFKKKNLSPEEDETIHNIFNIISIYVLNEKGNQIFSDVLKGMGILIDCWSVSSPSMAISTIVSAVATSQTSCEQFIDAGGLRKLFSAMNEPKVTTNKELCESLITLLNSLLTTLPPISTYFKRILRKFQEKEFEKIGKFIIIGESIFDNVDTVTDDDTFSVFEMFCCSLLILLGYSPDDMKIKFIEAIKASESLNGQLVTDTAYLLASDVPSIMVLILPGVAVINSLIC